MKRKNENQLFTPTMLEAYEIAETKAMANVDPFRRTRQSDRVQKAATIREEVEALSVIQDQLLAEWRADKYQMKLLREEAIEKFRDAGRDPELDSLDERLDAVVRRRANTQAYQMVTTTALCTSFPFLTALERLRGQIPRTASHCNDLLVRLAECGEQTFRVFPDLAEGLVRTRIRAPRSRLRMPYDTLEILLPPDIGRNTLVPDGQGGEYPMRSIVMHIENYPARPGEKAENTLEVTAIGRDDRMQAAVAHVVVSLRGLVFDVDADAGEMIDERAIREAALRYTNEAVAQEQSTWKALRLAINLILYVNSEEADVAASPQTRAEDEQAARDRKKGRKVRARGARISNVGRKVRLPGIRGGDAGDGTGPKLRFRHWVRGHWHMYWVGEGRAQTVMKWVAPYEKGRKKNLPRQRGRQYETDVPKHN